LFGGAVKPYDHIAALIIRTPARRDAMDGAK
jgi:hypothetical protein